MLGPIVWRKSSFSGHDVIDHCIELAAAGGRIKLRESDTPAEVIITTPARLREFISAVKSGQLDHLT
ncbi:DUF397 domain-containing protein [Streptomyces sp. B1866]|uniref:DUF397 domain-containing protein n=1 Tax=Streptomyces sp. B1866 TaxID=3075431 RepID=UPI0028915D9F|nr:DUF397 domain-containing protein [Streptomyces sp. B1866]MDT3395840.1 DUF397 domain-containing protein [Streptomyces sp. B1866]